jgi:hypothetical protein
VAKGRKPATPVSANERLSLTLRETFDDPGFGQMPESACCPGSNSGIPSRILIPKNFPGIPQTLMRKLHRAV